MTIASDIRIGGTYITDLDGHAVNVVVVGLDDSGYAAELSLGPELLPPSLGPLVVIRPASSFYDVSEAP